METNRQQLLLDALHWAREALAHVKAEEVRAADSDRALEREQRRQGITTTISEILEHLAGLHQDRLHETVH